MVECLVPIFTVLGCFVYTIVYICKEKKLKSLFDRIESDWQIWSSGQESNILYSHAEDGRFLTILYTGYISLTMILYVAMTLTPQILDIILPLNETRPKKLPFPVEYFFNYDEYFYWILIHIFITATIEICVIIGCESVLAVFTEHVCGLFAIVGHRLRTMKRDINSNEINCQRSLEDIIYKDLTFCIEQHNRAIELY